MTVVKQCRQCGEVKPAEQFRKYYGGRQGSYTMCMSCERINSRAKYLEKKSARTPAEDGELNKIYQLYDAQRACGYRPPRRESGRHASITENLDEMIQNYTAKANAVAEHADTFDTTQTPVEIMNWLTCELTGDPDFYLDEVYEDLKSRYRPIRLIDPTTLLPVYDDTHAAALEAILARFNEYEDKYYED